MHRETYKPEKPKNFYLCIGAIVVATSTAVWFVEQIVIQICK